MPPSVVATQNTHPEDLKAAIRKTGRTLEQLSEDLGYAPPAVGMALRRRWHEVRVGIAKLLNRPIQELWPEDYYPDGKPKLHRPKQTKRRRRPSRRQKAPEGLAA